MAIIYQPCIQFWGILGKEGRQDLALLLECFFFPPSFCFPRVMSNITYFSQVLP